MQTVMIDSKNPQFTKLKAELDKKLQTCKNEHRMHSYGETTHYTAGKVLYVEYSYGFTEEETNA